MSSNFGPVESNDQGAPSLGQVAQTAQGGGQVVNSGGGRSDDHPLVQKFTQTLGELRDAMAPLRMQPAVPPQHQSFGHLLGSILTMGILPLTEHERAAQYNAYAQQHNQALDLHIAGLAKDLVNSDEHAGLADFERQLKMLQAQVGVAGLNLRQRHSDLEDFNGAVRDAYRLTEPGPKNPDEAEMMRLRGLHPSRNFPNRYVSGPEPDLPPRPGSTGGTGVSGTGGTGGVKLPKGPGGYEMPGPGPVRDALKDQGVDTGDTGTSGTTGGTTDQGTGTNDLGTISDTAAKAKAAREKASKLSEPTGQTRTMAEMAPDVLDMINTVREDMKAVKPGPGRSRLKSAGIALGMDEPAFQKYRTDILALKGAFIKMHAGTRGGGSPGLIKYYTAALNENMTPANMSASLDSMENYVRTLAKHGPEGLSATTTTPTSSTTSTSVGQPTASTPPTTGRTPGGINFRVVQ